MAQIRVTKTSEEAKKEMEALKRNEETKKKSRFCPECGKFQYFRKEVIIELLGTRAKYVAGYSYKCPKCGCEWELRF